MERARILNDGFYQLSETKKMKLTEEKIFEEVDLILSPSEFESKIIRELVPSCEVKTIAPYMFDDTQIVKHGKLNDDGYLLFVGGFSHEPNVDAVIYLVSEIMPLVWEVHQNVELVIVGKDFPTYRALDMDKRIRMLGHVDSLEEIYFGALATISPLRFGAGIKGKIIESLRYGVPTITSEIGIEGTTLKHNREVLVAHKGGDYASCVTSIINSNDLRESLSEAGTNYIKKNFHVRTRGKEILALLSSPQNIKLH